MVESSPTPALPRREGVGDKDKNRTAELYKNKNKDKNGTAELYKNDNKNKK